jgi:isopentenyl phosphate kinase
MHKPLVVIKLGGAAITDKKNIYAPRLSVIRMVAKQLVAIKENFSIIIVHGAGSYGHIPVRNYGLTRGFTNPKKIAGLIQTKSKLLELEMTLNQILCQHGLPVISMLASDCITTQKGRIKACDLEGFKRWLGLGCIPMIGGDIVPDRANGFAIISGDQIAVYLSVKLDASKLIFGTDVGGVFDSNPNLKATAKLLPKVHVNSVARTSRTNKDVTDVTGGMSGKLTESITALRNNVPVFIVTLLEHSRLLDVAYGRKTICSEIVR